MFEPSVSIIVPNLNGEQCLTLLLDSIKRQNYTGKMEVIMVDNASGDKSCSLTAKKYPWVKIIRLKKNNGYAAGFNTGFRHATGMIVIACNNDVVLHPECLKEGVKPFQDPLVGCVGPKTYGTFPSKKPAMAGLSINPYLGYSHRPLNHHMINTKQTVNWLSGCFLFIRKDLIDQIDSFDPEYYFYYEEADLGIRAVKAGYRLVYNPRSIIWHEIGHTAIKMYSSHQLSYFWYAGKFRCLLKNATVLQIATSLIFILATEFYKGLIIRDGTLKPFLAAVMTTIRQGPQIYQDRCLEGKKIKRCREELIYG
jgi:hypothetical protein